MKNTNVAKTRWLIIACVGVFLFDSLHLAMGGRARQEDETRDLTRTAWKERRKGAAADAAPGRYKIIQRMPKGTPAALVAEDSEIGVTLWRLRTVRPQDAMEIREIVQHAKGGPREQWTPERVAADTAFVEKQMARLSIESLRAGFLYVINRTKYKGGTYGDPYLIFPTQQIYDGDNKVEAGRAIQIPGPNEEPFTVDRSEARPNELQESEELIILVTPQTLQNFPVAPPDRQKLSQESVENLIKKYAASYEVAEKIGSQGQSITIREKQASRTAEARLLTNDPYPQTIYRLAAKPGEAMLMKFEIKVVSK